MSDRGPAVAVIGPGLLGGSVAMGVRSRLPGWGVRVWGRRPEALAPVRESGVADVVSPDLAEVVGGASLVVLATPVGVMADVVAVAAGSLGPGVVVTDVGSVKEPVVTSLAPVVAATGATFLGSHPMAGSEQTGFSHSRADLFEGAACVVTPVGSEPVAVVEEVRSFWSALGCRVLEMRPGVHDRLAARVSHVPHAVAAALVESGLAGDGGAVQLIGSGFRDTTRVAAGDADLWTGILSENRGAVVEGLRDVAAVIERLASALEGGDSEAVRQFLDRARKLRQGCPPRHGPGTLPDVRDSHAEGQTTGRG